jgi:hypothetical protein
MGFVNKPKYKFHSKEFRFPERAYIGLISIEDPEGNKHSVCLTRVFDNFEVLKRYVLFVIDDFSKNSNTAPSYNGFCIKADFSRLIPLKKQHWVEKKQINTNIFTKSRNDVNIIKYWKMSEIIVTPDGEIDNVEFFSFCFSLFKKTPSEDVDLIIRNSNHQVDMRAKNAAFYTLNKPVKINWVAGIKKSHEIKIIENYIN